MNINEALIAARDRNVKVKPLNWSRGWYVCWNGEALVAMFSQRGKPAVQKPIDLCTLAGEWVVVPEGKKNDKRRHSGKG